jgi:6-phosphogluconolactonase (cycloisomerase 2 family)
MQQKLFLSIAVLTLFACGQKSKSVEKIATKDTGTDNNIYLIVGTYTSGESKGIYVYHFDTITADAELVSMAEITNPSYLCISSDKQFVYSVTETGDENASASAFHFDKETGALSLLNTSKTQGADPCYIAIDKDGKHIITANYSGGSISAFNINEDGTLSDISQLFLFTGAGKDPKRQAAPHLHWVGFSPDKQYLYANDLGTDRIYKYHINQENKYLTEGVPSFFKLPAGTGPRHSEFHPNGKFMYLISELSGEVLAFHYDNLSGDLTPFQTIPSDTLQAQGSADIHITPDGRFLYASNRLKGDGLAIFTVNQETGELTKTGYQETGKHPRNFMITPNGKMLLVACRDSNVIQVFNIDSTTGLLTNLNKDIALDKPVCLKVIDGNKNIQL